MSFNLMHGDRNMMLSNIREQDKPQRNVSIFKIRSSMIKERRRRTLDQVKFINESLEICVDSHITI